MPARLVEVTILNSSDFPIIWQDDGRPDGFWQEPWYPSNIKHLAKGQQATFRLESGGIATGVKGWAKFKVDIPVSPNFGDQSEFFTLSWERPYIGHFEKDVDYPLQHDRYIAYIKDHGFSDIANMSSSPLEFVLAIPGAPLTAPIFLNNDANAKHVSWYVELLNAGTSSSLPLRAITEGIIYNVDSNNNVMWYRHDGRDDGSFKWFDNNARKVGVGWSGKHIFSGGDGVIYVVTDSNDLMWFRHDGRNDGSFQWADNNGKKVGVGWSGKHIFSGGDGVIYVVTDNNDLMWFRHDGRNDGSFKWADNNGKKVGVGWSGKHIFSGGDGVIYVVTDNNDLMWFRHDGRNDGSFKWADNNGKKVGVGWGGQHIFSGGDGVIYIVTDNNDLMWFRHDGRNDGSFKWADNNGKKVGVGWSGKFIFSGGD